MDILEIFEYSLEHVSADISRYVWEDVAGGLLLRLLCAGNRRLRKSY